MLGLSILLLSLCSKEARVLCINDYCNDDLKDSN